MSSMSSSPAAVAVLLLLQVDGNDVPWVGFKRVDTRSFMMSTNDIMSFYYITLPRGE